MIHYDRYTDEPCLRPSPGPGDWDWRCLVCGWAIEDHVGVEDRR